jgi:prepilin-type N-terminal cleavage/methylation domain
MKKEKVFTKKEKGFTLVEMMIVLFVITILLLITIPNVTKNNETIGEKGCEGMVKMVETQVQAYYLEHGVMPGSIEQLVSGGYFEEPPACPNGRHIVVSGGEVTVSGP